MSSVDLVEFGRAITRAVERAEKAERERAEAWESNKRLYEERDEAVIRRDRAIAACEKMRGERDEAGWLPVSAWCKSCEGPLTCAKCVPVQAPGVDKPWPDVIDDHEARLKELAEKVTALEDFCGQKCQQCGGYILRHVEGCPAGHRR